PVRAAAASVHGGAARRGAPPGVRPPSGDPGSGAVARGAADGVRVRATLFARGRALSLADTGAARDRASPFRGVLPSRPRGGCMSAEPVLEVEGLVKHFPVRGFGAKGVVHAVDDVSFTIGRGELLGLVGESGSGKSTVANCIMRLVTPTDGTIRLKGTDITHLSRRALRPLRRDMHMVFQDPYSSLDPRMTCGQIVGE